jgi:hypothetical protein
MEVPMASRSRPFSLQIELVPDCPGAAFGRKFQGSSWNSLDGARAQADGLLNSEPNVLTVGIFHKTGRRKARLVEVRDFRHAAAP